MPDVIINGPEGRIEARYHHSRSAASAMALVLHPHPQHGGTMNNKLVHALYQSFVRHGFSTLRFNFRGVGPARAASIAARANCPMPPRRSIGCRPTTPTPEPAGSPAFRSAPGSACSC
jgi:hypothetical protein